MDISEYKAGSHNAELILACGGSSVRMGQNKLLMDIGGKPCLLRTCLSFVKCRYIKRIIIAAPCELQSVYSNILSRIDIPISFVESGETRQKSIHNAVMMAREDIIMIHDGARPLVSSEIAERSVEDAFEYGSSIVCVKSKDTVRYDDGKNSFCPNRECLYNVQTPQSFSRILYLHALNSASCDYTDDAQLLDAVGIKPHITMGEYSNIKITTAEDIAMANSLLGILPRIGHGYDVHRLSDERKLIIGGVEIPYDKGLLGHSDADVLTHAIMDSLLGAAALGDIGKLFPDSEIRYKGANSIKLLEIVRDLLESKGYKVINIDATVIAQSPKLSPYISEMRQTIAVAVGVRTDDVSIKATTEEKLGFTGSGDGIAAHAVAMIVKG